MPVGASHIVFAQRMFKDRNIIKIFQLFIVLRLILLFVSYLTFIRLHRIPFYKDIDPIFSSWLVFDSIHFLEISRQGYSNLGLTAFFPFWPLIIANLSKIFFFIDYRLIGLLASNIITYLDCHLLYLIIREDYGRSIAYKTVKYFLFFPMSFFLVSAYSESTFLFLVLLSFYFLRTNQHLLGGFSGFLASITKPFGILLIIPLLIGSRLEQNKKAIIKYLSLTPIFLGVPLYMLYLYLQFGDPMIFLKAHNLPGWEARIGIDGFYKLWIDLKLLISFKLYSYEYLQALTTTGLFLFFIFYIVSNYKKISRSYLAYSLVILLTPLFTNSLINVNRYSLLVFPFFLILSINNNREKEEIIILTFLVLLGFYTAIFTSGRWIG